MDPNDFYRQMSSFGNYLVQAIQSFKNFLPVQVINMMTFAVWLAFALFFTGAIRFAWQRLKDVLGRS